MRKVFVIFLTILYQFAISSGIRSDSSIKANQALGIPSAESYSETEPVSRVPWDMVIVDNKLYLGGGDFSKNTGPVDIWTYDLLTGQWSVSGTLNDEAIGKFIVIDDRVYAPGFDAKGGSWAYGNYHYLEDGLWKTNDKLIDAVHNFDVSKYNDMLFFAIGTGDGTVSPVKVSCDDGQSFSDVAFIKNNENILNSTNYDFLRVYDFFKTETDLFCMLLGVENGTTNAYEFYKFENGEFHYISSSAELNLNIKVLKQEPISSKVFYRNACYIAAGYLTRTTDFLSAEQLVLPNNEIAVDLLVQDDQLFVLSAISTDSGYSVRIYAYVYNSFFYPVSSFDSENVPVSFAMSGNNFYVGLNSHGTDESMAGVIYELTVPELTLQVLSDCLN